jgi:integrase
VVSARFRVLHSAISWALRNKMLARDPLNGMRAPSRRLPRMHLRVEQVQQLVRFADEAVEKAEARLADDPEKWWRVLEVFRAEQNALLVRLAADSAARRGELVALQDTDLEGRTLWIVRASQDGIISPVKNHLNGQMTLAAGTATYWWRHVERWAGYLPTGGEAGTCWMFRAEPGSVVPLLPNGLGQRFLKFVRRAGCGVAAVAAHGGDVSGG